MVKLARCLLAIASLFGALLLAGGTATAQPARTSMFVAGCPGFPGNPAGGVCLYEPTNLEPRYGAFHAVKRSDGQTFSIPYLVGFIDVNSFNCAVQFYDVTYPGGVWTLEYLFSVWEDTNNGYGGYIVPSNLQNRVDYAKFTC